MSPKTPATGDAVYKNIVNPKAQQKPEWDILSLVERPASLEGKTVYLINQRWGGTQAHEPLLLEMKKWLESNIKGIKVVYKVKLGSYHINDVNLWKEVSEKADAALIGVPA
ncbi:MAG: hypothetical protein JW712_07725 [Dehalococcoidales bacterium]|nr:hypothetical protein [Dehalococcoidales bacterium]